MRTSLPLVRSAVLLTGLVLVTTGFLSGCTTATYGQSFVADEKVANQYRTKIYVGAFSGGDTADKSAKVEIEKYMAKEKFAAYKITDRRYNLLPEYYEYTVLFTPR